MSRINELAEKEFEEVKVVANLMKMENANLAQLQNYRKKLFPRFNFDEPIGYFDSSVGSISQLLPFFGTIKTPIYHPLNKQTCRQWYGIEFEALLELTRMGIINPLFDFAFNYD